MGQNKASQKIQNTKIRLVMWVKVEQWGKTINHETYNDKNNNLKLILYFHTSNNSSISIYYLSIMCVPIYSPKIQNTWWGRVIKQLSPGWYWLHHHSSPPFTFCPLPWMWYTSACQVKCCPAWWLISVLGIHGRKRTGFYKLSFDLPGTL